MAAQSGREPEERSSFGWLRRFDDTVFAVEQTIVTAFLIAMALMMFLDVVNGRLEAQDSKVGQLIAKIAMVDDAQTREAIDRDVAPWVGGGLGLLLVWFGFSTAERHRKRPLLKIKQSALVLTGVTAVAIALTCWLMLSVKSKHFYLMAFAAATIAWLVHALRKKPKQWKVKTAAHLLVATPVFAWFCLTWVPEGYTWSQELSLMILLWIGFLGASVCAHEGKHLRMEAFDRMLPPKMARWIHAAGFLVAAGFCAFMTLLGYRYVTGPSAAGESSQMHIPDRVSIIAVPIAFGLTSLRFLGAAVSSAMGGRYGWPAKEDSLAAAERRRKDARRSDADPADAPGPDGSADADDADADETAGETDEVDAKERKKEPAEKKPAKKKKRPGKDKKGRKR